MTDAYAEKICRSVREYLKSNRFDILNSEDFARLSDHTWHSVGQPSGLDKDDVWAVTAVCVLGPDSIDYTNVYQGDLGERAPANLRAIPRGARSCPPEDIRDDFLAIVRKCHRNQLDTHQVRDLCIAYGCGKWRTVNYSSNRYHGLWQGGFCALQRDVLRAVTEASTWLAACVAQYTVGNADALWSDADMVTMIFARPLTPLYIHRESTFEILCTDEGATIRSKAANMGGRDGDYEAENPSGSKFVFSIVESSQGAALKDGRHTVELAKGMKIIVNARDGETWIRRAEKKSRYDMRLLVGQTAVIKGPVTLSIWECSCAWNGCERSHRIESWDPAKGIKLRSYAKSAVKGPQPAIQSTSFTQGIYCGVLAQEGLDGVRLRLAPVEFKVCGHCSVFPPEKHPGFKSYEGDQCPYCKTPFQAERTHKIARDCLIVVGKPLPVYTPALRVRCSNGNAHYRKVTGRDPTGNVSDKWDNLCDLAGAWTPDDEMYVTLETDAPQTPAGYSERDIGEADEELQRARERRADALRIRCPLCNEPVEIVVGEHHHPPRPTTIWFRRFIEIIERDDPTKWESLDDETDDFDLSEMLLRTEDGAVVKTALGQLDDEDRGLITLYHIQQLSFEEISQETNASVEDLEAGLPKAEERLRKHLKALSKELADGPEGVNPNA